MTRALEAVCFLGGAALLALAAWSFFASPPETQIEAGGDIELTPCAPGEKQDVVLRLHNRSGRPARIFGMSLC